MRKLIARSRTPLVASPRDFDSIADCNLSLHRTLMNLFSVLSLKDGPGGLLDQWNQGKSLLAVWMLNVEVRIFGFSYSIIVIYADNHFSLTRN